VAHYARVLELPDGVDLLELPCVQAVAPGLGINRVLSHVAQARSLKEAGNQAFNEGHIEQACALYTQAIAVLNSTPEGHALVVPGHDDNSLLKAECLGNRSHAMCSASDGDVAKCEAALEDALAAIQVDPSYAKGYVRKATALDALGRPQEAASARSTAMKRSETKVKNETGGSTAYIDDSKFTDLVDDGSDPLSKELTSKELDEISSVPSKLFSNYHDRLLKGIEKAARRGMVRLQLALLVRAGNAYLSVVKDEDILTTPVAKRKGRKKLLQSIYNAGVDLAGEAQSIAHGRHESMLCRRFFKTSLAILKHIPRTFGFAYSSFSCNYGIFCRDEGSVTEAIAAFEVSCSFDNGDALVELGSALASGLMSGKACGRDIPRAKELLQRAKVATLPPPCDYRKRQVFEAELIIAGVEGKQARGEQPFQVIQAQFYNPEPAPGPTTALNESDSPAAQCLQCGSCAGLKRCGGCKRVFFCGTECLRAAWKGHKKECKQWREEALAEEEESGESGE